MKKILVVLAALCVCGARAEERTVSTAADLVAALEALNSNTAPAEPNVIYLEPGSYDVSAYSMPYWNGDGNTQLPAKHLALSRVTVSGKTDNPARRLFSLHLDRPARRHPPHRAASQQRRRRCAPLPPRHHPHRVTAKHALGEMLFAALVSVMCGC